MLVIGLLFAPTASAHRRHPDWWYFHHRPYPRWWRLEAACIRSHEGWWTANTGNGYYGAYQFLLSTWQSVGGRGLPSAASPAEQTYRAHRVWARDGGSWREWGTARVCGLS